MTRRIVREARKHQRLFEALETWALREKIPLEGPEALDAILSFYLNASWRSCANPKELNKKLADIKNKAGDHCKLIKEIRRNRARG